MSMAETSATICALMDSQITEEEFDRGIERNKLLHDCKTKGFKHLQKLGPLDGGVGIKVKPESHPHEWLRFCQSRREACE